MREAAVQSDHWVLYFNAKGEQARFLESLGQAWRDHFKVRRYSTGINLLTGLTQAGSLVWHKPP